MGLNIKISFLCYLFVFVIKPLNSNESHDDDGSVVIEGNYHFHPLHSVVKESAISRANRNCLCNHSQHFYSQ